MATIGPSKEPICFYNSDPPPLEINQHYGEGDRHINQYNVITCLRLILIWSANFLLWN